MKTRNSYYIRVTAIICIVYLFFFTSKYWIPNDREMRNLNYDTVFEVDNWKVKINNAVYDSNSKTMTFDLYEYAGREDYNPLKYTVYLGKKTSAKEPLKFEIKTIDVPSNSLDSAKITASRLTVSNVLPDYWYVSVNFECVPYYSNTNSDIETKTDIFGFENKIKKAEALPVQKSVQLDYREVTKAEK